MVSRQSRLSLQARSISGFTLIEMVVSIGILALLIGGGIAAFIKFQDRQQMLSAAHELKFQLRSAQIRARSNALPAGCSNLQSHAVQTVAGADRITIAAVCDGAQVDLKQVTLPGNVTVQDAHDVRFLPLHGGVSGATTITLESSAGYVYQFEITQGGEITEGVLTEQ